MIPFRHLLSWEVTSCWSLTGYVFTAGADDRHANRKLVPIFLSFARFPGKMIESEDDLRLSAPGYEMWIPKVTVAF